LRVKEEAQEGAANASIAATKQMAGALFSKKRKKIKTHDTEDG